TVFATEKSVVVAPMPRTSMGIAVREYPGCLSSLRNAICHCFIGHLPVWVPVRLGSVDAVSRDTLKQLDRESRYDHRRPQRERDTTGQPSAPGTDARIHRRTNAAHDHEMKGDRQGQQD